MSGICGVVLHGLRRTVATEEMESMCRAMAGGTGSAGDGPWRVLTLGRAGLGAVPGPGVETAVAQRALSGRGVAIALQGTIVNASEIANASEGRPDLAAALLARFAVQGVGLLDALRGEFVLALWDGLTQTLHLATDRFRTHPLFYCVGREGVAFSSRLSAISESPWFADRTLHPESLLDVIALSFIPTPKTIFREVKKLPPGTVLTVHGGAVKETPYWNLDFLHPCSDSETALAAELRLRFDEAVAVRATPRGDWERVGAFLSGGIDSSTVTGVLTRVARRPIKTFSIGFEEPRFNEIAYARLAARAFGSEHHEYFVSAGDTYEAVPVLLDAVDEPYANASAVATYFCAKLARERGVDLLFAGDAGDELFAGNKRYATQRLFDYYGRIPRALRAAAIEPLVGWAADRLRWPPFVAAKKYIRRATIPYPQRLSSYGLFRVLPAADVFTDEVLDAVGRDYDPSAVTNRLYFEAPARSELDRQLYIDLKLAIGDNDLVKVTRMAAAAGISVRFPFLDHQLAEFAATIPAGVKMRGRCLRSFFKRAYADLLPVETRKKTKHGFGLPIPEWLRTDRRLRELMHDALTGPGTQVAAYLRPGVVPRLIDAHQEDRTSFFGTILWNFIMLELWLRRERERGVAARRRVADR